MGEQLEREWFEVQLRAEALEQAAETGCAKFSAVASTPSAPSNPRGACLPKVQFPHKSVPSPRLDAFGIPHASPAKTPQSHKSFSICDDSDEDFRDVGDCMYEQLNNVFGGGAPRKEDGPHCVFEQFGGILDDGIQNRGSRTRIGGDAKRVDKFASHTQALSSR